MSIYTEVKEQIKLRDVAEYYGLHINRAGFTNCPFHKERTPSMKLYDDHFYCFGCQNSGDAITLVEKLFGLQPLDAAKKLQHDFGLAEVAYGYKKGREHFGIIAGRYTGQKVNFDVWLKGHCGDEIRVDRKKRVLND